MTDLGFSYEGYSTRAGFNTAVRHVKSTLALIQEQGDKQNLADLLNVALGTGTLKGDQIPVITAMILKDKLGYCYASKNLETPVADGLEGLATEISGWNAVDLVLVYYHPDVGPIVVNPKNAGSWTLIGQLKRNELVVAYAGDFAKKANPALCGKALGYLFALMEGQGGKIPAELRTGDCAYKVPKAAKPAKVLARHAAAPKKAKASRGAKAAGKPIPAAPAPLPTVPAASPVMKRTPMYSVQVTNELFHNGNVEAWKRIIASYEAKHPTLSVLVYYDGERITNINSLFKWGKVKSGSSIQFSVSGDNIKDVAKLQRYLIQGASPAFEAFLVGAPSTILNLF